MAKKINVRPLRFWLLWDDVLSFMSVAFIWAIQKKWSIFLLARYGRFSIFRFCVSVRKCFAHLWTQQLSISMLQNCTEHVILVDKQLTFYSTFWSDPIFMPKLANTWPRRLHSRGYQFFSTSRAHPPSWRLGETSVCWNFQPIRTTGRVGSRVLKIGLKSPYK